jgi:hypothetical protein
LAVSLGDYELTLTVYFDYLRAMATMRSKYVPEEGLFRNLINQICFNSLI